jgi:hypothetical protein
VHRKDGEVSRQSRHLRGARHCCQLSLSKQLANCEHRRRARNDGLKLYLIKLVFIGSGINWIGEFAPEIGRVIKKKAK